jgi:hypothetical protein
MWKERGGGVDRECILTSPWEGGACQEDSLGAQRGWGWGAVSAHPKGVCGGGWGGGRGTWCLATESAYHMPGPPQPMHAAQETARHSHVLTFVRCVVLWCAGAVSQL